MAGLYLSTPGISYMFYHLSENTLMNENKQYFLNKAEEYIRPALEKINKEKPYFILGSAGIYAVATALYHAKGDQNRFHQYGQIFNQLSEYFKQPDVSSCGADELFVGRAGITKLLTSFINLFLYKYRLYYGSIVVVKDDQCTFTKT